MSNRKHITIENHSYPVEHPDQCPICHRYSEVEFIKATETKLKKEVNVVFRCGFSGCKSFFIGYFGEKNSGDLRALKPAVASVTTFPDCVLEISPQFIEIYLEAEEAKSLGLHQVAGPGYRKAFEFLVKDYAKSLNPSDLEQIEKMFSGNVVKEYMSDPRIKNVAQRALWLGNDETHYLRKWVSHDLDDLINLIKLAVNWIETEILSKKYEEEMPKS